MAGSNTIGSLARRVGVNVETIRYYERRGLLRRPSRPESGYREYPPDAVRQVRFIKRAQSLGFSLREIRDLLDLGGDPRVSCAEVLSVATRKLADIETKIRTLETMRALLLELTKECPGKGGLSRCPIWQRLEAEDERR